MIDMALIYRIGYRTPAGKRGGLSAPMPLAQIVGVPSSVSRDAVEAALQAWPRWAHWLARAGVTSQMTITRHYQREPDEGVEIVEWSTLSPDEKRISLTVDGELWAEASRAARISGMSLQQWSIEAIRTAIATSKEPTS